MASATADSSSVESNAASAAAADARGKRPVWNVPSNGAIEVGPVMGAVSWPALSESTKASPKSSSSDSLKSLSDGSTSAPPGPLVSSPSVKPTTSVPIVNQIQNSMSPARQKSMKRGSIPANGEVGSQSAPDKQTFSEPSPRGSKSGGPTQQPHGGGDYHRGYGVNRRGNNSGGPHHNHGNRREQDWNHHRNAHVQHQHQRGGIRSYPRPPSPPVSSPFIPPSSQLRPYVGNAMCFPDVHPMYFVPPDSLGSMPLVPHLPHAMFFSAMDPQRALLLKQIDYYFSSENLCKDIYLRQNMDDQGWVPISLIAGFNRVKHFTNNIQYILDTVRLSTLLEVQGEKIRRRNDWINWLLLPSNHLGSTSGTQSLTATDYDAVAVHIQSVGLDQNNMRGPIRAEVVLTRSASGNLNNQFQIVGDPSRDGRSGNLGDRSRDGSGQFIGFSNPDRSNSSRTLSRSDTL